MAVYFALPPQVSQLACEVLTPGAGAAGTRLVMEKPFGSGEESARQLNRTLLTLVPEDHIHRVDHFLGKATVLNILGLRFANTFLEPVWNREHIEKVEIIFDEDLALEGRARYYDGAGALRDMIQSHLLQIMALMAIEPPATMGERDLRDAVAAVLRASSIKPPYADQHPPRPLHRRHHRRAGGPRLRQRGGRGPGARHRDAGRGPGGHRQLALEGRPLHPALRQGPGRQAQGSGGHVPARCRTCRRLHRAWTPPTSSGSASGRTPCSSTSTSTARATSSAWTGSPCRPS